MVADISHLEQAVLNDAATGSSRAGLIQPLRAAGPWLLEGGLLVGAVPSVQPLALALRRHLQRPLSHGGDLPVPSVLMCAPVHRYAQFLEHLVQANGQIA